MDCSWDRLGSLYSVCGICGKIVRDPHAQIAEADIRRMCAVLRHRGPDESGVHVQGQFGLGHQRLSIIDLTTGQQPMCNARRDLWIVFNGEIYNFAELRADLETQGYRFRSQSDTEVILHLYDAYGLACVHHLRGMFAFGIWDARAQRLVLVRDRVGQKPLFYRLTDESIAFASEIKALLEDRTVPRALNLTAMHHYLTYQYVPPPETMFQGILKLPPAHTLLWEGGKVRLERYWQLSYVPKVQMEESEILAALTDLLQESVRLRMISDVPIGAFLSGGIDSSLVVAMMAQASTQPVNTFSIGFKEEEFNELPYARMIAERYQTDHHEFIVEPDAVDILPKLIWHFDEPFGDSSAIPTYYVAQMTSQSVKVALNGDGGDESFAGYLRYLSYTLVRLYRLLPKLFRQRICAPLFAHLKGVHPLFRRLHYVNNLSLESQYHLYARTMTIFDQRLKAELYTDDVRSQVEALDSLDYMLAYLTGDSVSHLTDRMLYSDVMTYLPGDLLVKVDRMTMAHSLEGRSPFLDHRLMEFAAALPAHFKLRGTRLKFLLKQVGERWLPPEILKRTKQGFGVPIGQWFRHELRDLLADSLLSSTLARDGIINPDTLHRLFHEHQTGIQDHRHRLWVFLNLELWYRTFITHG
ncbi:asparagine synthase (glutamine-hydrolyzing) [candidate division KSB3 bacterium]|uniref:asparagine synthase (glutamine-hydrolyzing) n=1 Tax=candidate division KSB3 bacterium TaxID=2044937 RepID=A0A9D5JUX4_9BACT|nr:asparagine synthase (glutamine-hydrolyzing) [candidate division KSB3 bacterium]MBD3324714.1 asparagine synthase (glutamine-hydrolyzing) [candidate division KSB3 bacterium]